MPTCGNANHLPLFHGLNRYGFKGTKYVEEAFRELQQRYPNDLELIIDGKLPLDEYLSVMRRANIVIDQVNSYSLGMNGLYALAMGKIVLGGAEREGLRSLGIEKSPVFNIEPCKDSIVQKIEEILETRNLIPELGCNSRRFVEDVHCHIKIGQRYVETWAS